jgi:hypothetical protein
MLLQQGFSIFKSYDITFYLLSYKMIFYINMLATPVTARKVMSPMMRNERSRVGNDADVASRQNIRVALIVNNSLIEKLSATLMKYIKSF